LSNLNIGNKVEIIPRNAFYNMPALQSVTIPASVTTIGDNAFQNCGLTTVTIPENIQTVGWTVFSYCKDLHTVNFNATNCTKFGNYSDLAAPFYECPALTTLNIGNKVKSIPDWAFAACPALTVVNFGESLKTIGQSAFYRSLTGDFVIPSSVDTIGTFAFNFSGFSSLTISEDVKVIGHRAFNYCKNLQTVNFNAINSSMQTGEAAFDNCTAFTTLNIGNKVKTIPPNIFSNCGNLTVNMGKSVETIGMYAFAYSGITSITIPESVKTIGSEAFSQCENITSITTYAVTPPALGTIVFYSVPNNIPVYIPCRTINSYKASNWNYFSNFIVNGMESDTTHYQAQICQGETYSDDNFTGLTKGGDYPITYQGVNSCDSVVILQLTVKFCPVYGCTDPYSENYNPLANVSNDSCVYKTIDKPIKGCTDDTSVNYNPVATIDDGSCIATPKPGQKIYGCTDIKALNFNPNATDYDYEKPECQCVYANEENTFNAEVTGTPVDTVGTKPLENCKLKTDFDITEVSISQVDVIGLNEVKVHWVIKLEGGITILYEANYTVTQSGVTLFYLSVICKGDGLKSLRAADESVTGFTVSATANVGSLTNICQPKATANIAIFPNPTTGMIYIEPANGAIDTQCVASLQLRTLQGILLIETTGNKLDLSAYPQGVYLLQVNGEMVKVVKR